jgi:hypothetical protein
MALCLPNRSKGAFMFLRVLPQVEGPRQAKARTENNTQSPLAVPMLVNTHMVTY